MPFIGGRFYANALAGQAIEAAREAEAALLALKPKAAQNGDDGNSPQATETDSDDTEPSDAGDEGDSANSTNSGYAPVHRVEIETTELVPSHTGRGQQGFVARVHRAAIPTTGPTYTPVAGRLPSRGYLPKPETHVFSGHGDLLDFLKTELARKGPGK